MTFLLGVVLIIGIFLWRTDSSLEWSIPLKWQTFIRTWQKGFGDKTHILTYVWYFGPENSELERNFWHLQMALPRLRNKFRAPLWIEVYVREGLAPGQQEIYIACLRRRFPEIEIYECLLNGSSGDEEDIQP